MNLLEQALKIAIMAHEGQKDLDGNPALLHPISVGFAGANEDELITGILHDVMENSEVTPTFMQAAGIPPHIITALEILTHDTNLPYEEYIQNILHSGNELALRVKLNDLRHNIKRGKVGGHTKQVQKHERALSILTGGE